jgi:hypothetical protein
MNVAYQDYDEVGIAFFINNIQKRDVRFTMQIELYGQGSINMLQAQLNKSTMKTLGEALIKAATSDNE